MKKFTKFLAALLCLCLLLTACAPAEQEEVNVSDDSRQVQNLEKLCLVWGYTKYHHPAFLLGEKDWDKELLNLIPTVSEAKEEKVNDILHEWFVGLGEIDYGTLNWVPQWAAAKEEDKIVQADTSWINADYLGDELKEDLSQLGPVPNIDRSKAPVKFNQEGVADFSNEPTNLDFDYSESFNRLLGLFRVWNAVEYYSPYLDIQDERWESILPTYIPKILEQADKDSYYLTLLEMMTNLHDGHVTLWDDISILFQHFGKYAAPVELTMAEGEWVVSKVWDSGCALHKGDIITKVDGIEIEQVVDRVIQSVSIPNEQKMVKNISPWLLRSPEPAMEIGVLRDGTEQLLEVDGTENYYPAVKRADVSHELVEGNIGVIHPSQVKDNEIDAIMKEFQNTDGLIIDLREYPTASDFSVLPMYIMKGQIAMCANKAAQAVPGAYVKENQWAGNLSASNPYYQQRGIYEYDGSVVVLIDQLSQSAPELNALAMGSSDRVTLLGNNTLGSVANISLIPVPGGNTISFSSVGVTTTDGKQIQRIGLAPDIEVHPTIEGIKEGRDELMEAAIAYLQEQNLSSDAAPMQDNGEAPLGSPENPIAEEPQDNGEAPLGSPENPIAEEPQDNSEAPLGSPENPIAEEPQDNSEAPLGSPENPIAEEPQAE